MENYDLMQKLMMGIAPGQSEAPSPMMTPEMINQQMMAQQLMPTKTATLTKRTKIPVGPDVSHVMGVIEPQKSSYSEQLHALLSAQAGGIESQRQGVKSLEEQLMAQQKPEVNPLIASIFAASDVVNGSQFLPQHLQQQALQKQQFMQGANNLQKAKSDVSDKEIDLLKAQAGFAQDQERGELDREKMELMEKLTYAKINAERKNAEAKALTDANKDPGDLKDAQVMSATYGRRLQQAESVFNDLQEAGYDRTDRRENLQAWLPGEVTNENFRRQAQAERNFVNAILRKESGAAIGKDEFKSAEAQYFPRPGDTGEVVAQKRANRKQAMEGLKLGAGRAWNMLPQVAAEIGEGTVMGTPKAPKAKMSFEEWKKQKGK